MLYRRLVESRVREHGDDIVLTDGCRRVSLGELHRLAWLGVNRLQAGGAAKGDRVIVVCRNTIETAVSLLSCAAAGCIAVPIHAGYHGQAVRAVQQECGAKLIINGAWEEALAAPPQKPAKGLIDWDRELVSEEEGCYILYTSGSTGPGKGIFARQKQVLFCIDAIQKCLCYRKEDKVLGCLPLSFDYGLYQLFLALDAGAQLCLAESFPIQRLPSLVKQFGITVFPAMASTMNLLLHTRIWGDAGRDTVRMLTFTGEEVPEGLFEKLETVFPKAQLIPMYGLSECKRVSILPADRKDKREAGSCGLPLDGVSVRLADVEEESGIGELVAEGPNVMEGYWNRDEETRRVFGLNPATGQRFVRTGDRFRIDEEGFLYFCGRKSRLIKTGGFRFEPEELERCISQIPGVIQCRILGMKHKVYGEQICVCVYGGAEALEQVQEKLAVLPSYLPPCRLIGMDRPFPESRNGKIDVNELRKWIEKNE